MKKLTFFHNVGGINDLSIVQREENNDGWEEICETYNEEKFVKNGLSAKFVQDNEVYSGKGVLRGFGINTKVLQTKLIRVLNGKIYDVVIDLRADSKTFMKSFCVELSAKNGKQLYIPEGFDHAYLALEDSVIFFKVTSHFILGDEIGFSWNSNFFNIHWPMTENEMIFSDRDRLNPEFDITMVVKK